MTTDNDARRAHDVLDGLSAGRILSRENEQLLRSFLPELPKQKTLEEITAHVYDAWLASSDYEFNGNEYDPDVTIEDWLLELHKQLKGLKDTPTSVPALPAGMRLATHPEYGLCVVSPTTDEDGERRIFYLSAGTDAGADCRWVPVVHLTFIGSEPAHPEFLETEADYASAPVGTVVAKDNQRPAWKPNEHWFINNNPFDNREMAGGLNPAPRRVLRWGLGE